jgi:hypothetical protein
MRQGFSPTMRIEDGLSSSGLKPLAEIMKALRAKAVKPIRLECNGAGPQPDWEGCRCPAPREAGSAQVRIVL